MKKITILAAVVLFCSTAFAQKWTVDKAHSKLGFTVTHLMLSEVDGNFKKFDASITSSKDDFSDAVFELTADVNSINTENEMRDNDLKSDHFFDAAKYPQITFKSKSITKLDSKKYKLSGDLTMHGVTKPVTLDLTLNGIGKNMRTQKPLAGFKLTGTINRTDFGIGSMPSAVVSEEVEIRAVGEFGKE
ncbi:YceI family protein [Rubrolithibacter danxiaensis]|uniref:YceI family protein n=1 Tax=Rubrolithibacter danxiaensis TaxID=3390805 RepID=UPI003BF8D0CD